MKTNLKLLLAMATIGFASCDTSDSAILETENSVNNTQTTIENSNLTAKNTTVTSESALRSAISNAVAGDIITISGTINLTKTLELAKSGTSSSKINFTGGTLNCSGLPSGSWGVKVNGSYWNITNMTIKNAPDCGIVFQAGGYNYVYNVTTSNNGDSGLQIYNGSHDNFIYKCKSNDNYDAANGGENADGYACKLSAGKNNVFDGCVANHNSDDGWDLYGQPYTVTIRNCTASNNGFGSNGDGNGFKLGSANQNVAHTVTNNTATKNLAWGYDGNGNTGHITITGSGGSGNGKGLFARLY
ncbi:right-handed parallel beta-helix repeat-containing protein [Flavobacterium agrisoli]|uniref:Right-handed parallel beta-helix repeat-containing protein n=1 Tax=Flavobacterium agrisoli TaxID=2793066 RepID=A0A934PJ07_9FLAO|nr:right-handed parallel beta-helix repeat-containing protein [Flavobacterium agrisoli]MBK0368997.1 right-handed parallel beta-helix repeat-containing protein [Flavobacterium agrisoli]